MSTDDLPDAPRPSPTGRPRRIPYVLAGLTALLLWGFASVADEVIGFQMPGAGMPDFNRMAMDIANCIQGAIPDGASGGQVMFAMVLLIATGAKANMPTESHDALIADVVGTMEDVFEGRIVTQFVKEH